MTPRRHALVAAVVTATTLGGLTSAAASPPTAPPAPTGLRPTVGASVEPTAGASTRTVTLITGDVVHLTTLPGGRHSVSVDATGSPDGGRFAFSEQGGHVEVVPIEAMPYLADGQLDRTLFDVTTLITQGYDDASSDTLPLLLSAEPATQPAHPDTHLPATPDGARRGAELPAVGAVAVGEVKSRATAFWESIDDDSPGGSQPSLAGGTRHVWLDQQLHATRSDSTPAGPTGHTAPTGPAAGYDGHGVIVAVLDSGYDPRHPDLAGRVAAARNFTDEAGVTDEFGHGTHVASIIAGSGAASGGRWHGVAPGARLLVGKVLDHNGSGSESQVIAGMQWAVDHGARVVNMSMGGLPTDGTDPVSQAVDNLTASTGALFVVAAGNTGPREHQVAAPGSATSALTVGAVNGQDELASFSSRGPRLGDSAIKPDLVAPGVDIIEARAAGTSLGDIVNRYYTSLSGTSMATPRVAGAAAILAQEHPDWRAGQLSSALTATAHHLGGPTVDAQGAGRVDLAAAVSQQVTPDTASLAFGRVAYSGGPRESVSRTVTYHNGADAPATLDLDVDVSDTGVAPHHPAALTVSPQRLTIAPGESVSATVRLDPDATPPGTYAGYLTARTAGGVTLRGTIGFTVDGPLYPVHIRATDRAGHPASGINPLQLWDLDTGTSTFGALIAGQNTLQVPGGHYAVMTFVHTADASGHPRDVAMLGNPEFTVDGERTLMFDARTAHEFRLHTQDTTQTQGFILAWQRTAGGRSLISGLGMPGWISRAYANATTPVHIGTFRMFSRWTLAAVPLTARVTGPDGFDLATHPVGEAPLFDGHHRLDLVDAGLGRAEDFARIDARGRIALITHHFTGEVSDTPFQLDAAAAAGASGVLLVNDRPGLYLDGDRQAKIPAYTVEEQVGQRLRDMLAADGRVTVDLVGIAVSPFQYEAMLTESGRIPADLNYDLSRRRLARVQTDYHAQTDHVHASAGRMAFPPGVTTAFELQWPVNPPLRRVEYLTTGDTTWIAHTEADPFDQLGDMFSLARRYRPGQRDHEVWFPALTRPAVPAVTPDIAHGTPVSRFYDALRVTMPQHADGAVAHYGLAGAETTELTLARDGRTLATSNLPIAQFDVPGDPGRYQLTLHSARTQPWHRDWWTTSTDTTTTWAFGSTRPAAGRYTALPLVQVDYDLDTDMHNQLPAGHPSHLGLRVGYQPGFQPDDRDGFGAKVAVSFDDGKTWRRLPVHRRGHGAAFTVNLPAAPAGAAFGSLRVIAHDRHGNQITQTIQRAYRIGPR